MAQEQEYEVEIVDDSAHYVEDAAPEDTTPEDKAAAQAKAEQDQDGKTEQLSGKQRRSKLKERIDELTRKYRDEERTRYQIERERDQEREKFQEYQQSFQQEQENSARIVFSTLSDNKKLLETHLETARKMGDTKTENQIQDKLTDVRDRMGRLRQYCRVWTVTPLRSLPKVPASCSLKVSRQHNLSPRSHSLRPTSRPA